MAAPLFTKLTPDYKVAYDQFFRATNNRHFIFWRDDLSEIVELANKVDHALRHANPIWDTWENKWGDQNRAIEARQWHLDQLSHVKMQLALAIDAKTVYYEDTCMGKITKFILKLFGLWNHGNTAPIRKAEAFLLRYDSRYPIQEFSGGERKGVFFWPLLNHGWVNANLNARNFYNYDAPHAVEVKGGRNEEMPRFMVAVN